ncbi:glycosyl transferase [Bacteroidia bacterium]|nr:glycosyl transferase [Bacteroidia bacterium]
MKVLYVNVCITDYSHPLLNKLAAKGCEMVVLLPQKGDEIVGKNVHLSEQQDTLYRICYSRSKKMWYGKHALLDLKKMLQQEKPSILVMGYPYFLHLFFDRAIMRLLKQQQTRLMIREIPFQTPSFRKIKSYFSQNPLFNENMELKSVGIKFYIRQWFLMYIRKYVYSKVDATLNYHTGAFDILPSYGMDRKHIYVTYNSTDTEALITARDVVRDAPKLLPLSAHRLLHIGRLVKWKRVDLLIDAVKKLLPSFPFIQLVIIGNGPEEEILKRQVKERELADNVLFVGGVYDPNVLGAYMNESSVYVLAGMGGLSINDAMTYGLPIICSVCDGTERDLVEDGKNGFFFQQGNVTDLAKKIEQLLSSPERCKQMGKASERIITDKINIETVSERYYQAFKEVIEAK